MRHWSLPAIRTAFGAALADFRHRSGMSQEKLAAESELHRTYVSQLERGIKTPSLGALFALASALEVDASELITVTLSYLRKNHGN